MSKLKLIELMTTLIKPLQTITSPWFELRIKLLCIDKTLGIRL